jgi:hypothetical protein
MSKKQKELPTLERPTNKELDILCAAHLKAAESAKKATDKAATAKANIKAKMVELADEPDALEKDSDGNHVYTHRDGDQSKVFKLRHDDVLSVVNAKRVDDNDGSGELE